MSEAEVLRERLAALGFVTYADYLASAHWQAMKRRQPDRFCTWCKKTDRLHLHHQTYVRLGEEFIDDLAWLCGLHHWALHRRHRSSLLVRPGRFQPA